MTERKTDNKIKGKHFCRSGKLRSKEYIWHIPKHLRGTFEVGDVVLVDAKKKFCPVKVTEIFREEHVPGVNDYKMVRRTKLEPFNKESEKILS